MPKDKKYFSSEDRRQIEILGMCLPDIKDREAISIYELCELFIVSRPTIERDLNKLRERGIPIHSRSNEGVVVEGNVNEELLRKEFIRYIAVYYDDYFDEFIKLNGRDKEIAKTITNFVFLQNHIDNNTEVIINYLETDETLCYPRKIIRKEGSWLLVYEYRSRLMIKPFNEILDVRVSGHNISLATNLDLDAFIDRNFGFVSKTKYEVTLLFSTKMNGAFPTQISKAKVVQTDERGYRTVVAECADLDDLLYWILANYEKVMLLEPPELKERLMSKAKRMIKYYEAGPELFSSEFIEPPPYIRNTENPIKFYEPEKKESIKYEFYF